MNELQVMVTQTPGQVSWNFEELKAEVADSMKLYKGMVYTDETIPTARKDIASLRKLEKSVKGSVKGIKDKCLEPYNAIKEQADELTALIDEPIELIDQQIKEYEAKKKQENKDAILQFAKEEFESLPTDIAHNLIKKIYDPRWENISTPKKDWQTAIKMAATTTASDLDILKNVDEDFRETAYEVYENSLSLTDAMQKVQEMERQRKIILENERRREEMKRQQEEQARHEAEQAKPAATQAEPTMMDNSREEPKEMPQTAAEEPEQEEDRYDPNNTKIMLLIRGSEEQIRKIRAYIKYVGATSEVVGK